MLGSSLIVFIVFIFLVLGFNFFFENHFFCKPFFLLDPFLVSTKETDKQTDTLSAPYREKLRSSDSVFLRAYFFDIYDQGPAGPDPLGGPARPVQSYKK